MISFDDQHKVIAVCRLVRGGWGGVYKTDSISEFSNHRRVDKTDNRSEFFSFNSISDSKSDDTRSQNSMMRCFVRNEKKHPLFFGKINRFHIFRSLQQFYISDSLVQTYTSFNIIALYRKIIYLIISVI